MLIKGVIVIPFESSAATQKALLPEYITEIIFRNSSLQERAALRSFISGGYVVSRSKTDFVQITLCEAGPIPRNGLPPELRHMPDIQTFKRAVKTHIFNAAYNT